MAAKTPKMSKPIQYPCHCSQQANMQCVACNREGEITEKLRGDMNRLLEYMAGAEWTAAKMVCFTMQKRLRILERERTKEYFDHSRTKIQKERA